MKNEVQISRSNALGGFDILESQVRTFEYAAHRHAEVVIAVYDAGSKIATCEKDQFVVTAGDVLVIGPETLHKAVTLKNLGWRYRSIYLTPDQISKSTGFSLKDVERRVTGHRLHRKAAAMGRKFLHALEDVEHQPLALGDFLTDLFADKRTSEMKCVSISASVTRVHDKLRNDPASSITLTELSELAGLSPEYLSRQFKAAYGLSPFQFLTSVRAQRSKEKIAAGSSLSEAAYAGGFADQSHLNRWFRRIYGVSPGAFSKSQMRSRLK